VKALAAYAEQIGITPADIHPAFRPEC